MHTYASYTRFFSEWENRKAKVRRSSRSLPVAQHLTCAATLGEAGVLSNGTARQSRAPPGHVADRPGMAFLPLSTAHLPQCLSPARDTCAPLFRVKGGVKSRKRVKGHKCKKILLYFGGGWWGQKHLSILDVWRRFMHLLKPHYLELLKEPAPLEGGWRRKELSGIHFSFSFLYKSVKTTMKKTYPHM